MASNYEKQVDIGRQYFLKYDPEKLAAKFHLSIDESYFISGIWIRTIGLIERQQLWKEKWRMAMWSAGNIPLS